MGTADIFILEFDMWWNTCYLDPDMKQPKGIVCPSRFFDETKKYGSILSHFVHAELEDEGD